MTNLIKAYTLFSNEFLTCLIGYCLVVARLNERRRVNISFKALIVN